MKTFLDFLVTLICRFIGGAVMGGILGFILNWVPFMFGVANRRMPWTLLTWFLIGGGILGILTTPAHQRPWRRS